MKKEKPEQSKKPIVKKKDLNKELTNEKKRQEFLKKLRERY
jgi:hypothetical protein